MTYIDWTLTWNTVLAISTVVMALAIVATAGFAIIQLWNVRKTRCSALLMQLNEAWDSKEYIESRRMINQHYSGSTPEEASQKLKESMISYDKANAEEYFIIVRIANFFENLGFLACENYLDRKDAKRLFGGAARNYWNLFSALVKYDRFERDPKRPDVWIYFEKLALEVSKKQDA